MKVLYYDCFSGISGDMNLAALIDLGVPKEYLVQELSKVNLNSEYEIKVERSVKLGITGTRVDVILKDKLDDKTHISEQTLHSHNNEHTHEQSHIDEENLNHHHSNDEHNHNGSNHNREHSDEEYAHNYEHHHRNLKDIEEIINSSWRRIC